MSREGSTITRLLGGGTGDGGGCCGVSIVADEEPRAGTVTEDAAAEAPADTPTSVPRD